MPNIALDNSDFIAFIPFVKVPGLVSPPVRAVEKSFARIGASHACGRPLLNMYVRHFAVLEDKIAITKNASAGHKISHSCEPEIACDNVDGHWSLRVGLRRTAPWNVLDSARQVACARSVPRASLMLRFI
jgi:hypothetical protein